MLFMMLNLVLAAGKVDVDLSKNKAETAVDPCAVQQLANDIDQLKRDAGKEGTKMSDSVGCTFQAQWNHDMPTVEPTLTKKQQRQRRRAAKRTARQTE